MDAPATRCYRGGHDSRDRTPNPMMEAAMLPQLPQDEQRPVCHGCGQAKFLPYSIRSGDPATAKVRVYCSIACAQLHSPGFTGKDPRQ